MKRHILFSIIVSMVILISLPQHSKAMSVVSSSVSVHADSSGGSESSVRVISKVNGEVVEDWHATSTEPIVYQNTVVNKDGTETISPAERIVDNRSTLEAIIKRLQGIIQLYVTLLQQT